MPKTAYINAFSTGHTKTASFAAIVDGEKFLYKIPGTMNQAELRAAQFVISGTPDGDPIELHTSNKYLISMLEYSKDGWVKNAVKNQEEITELRTAASKHGDVLLIHDKVTDGMLQARELARSKQERK